MITSKMKILVTGNRGFIGTHISMLLSETNAAFTGIDKGDTIPKDRFDIILHFGARTLIRNSLQYPYEYFTDNEGYTMQILEKCRRDDSVIVFPTSGSVSLPTNPYSLSKKNGEDWVKMYTLLYGVKSHILKLFNIYGEGSRKGAVYLFSKAAAENKPAIVYGDGTHRRDFVYVKDLVNYIYEIINAKISTGVHEIGTGIGTSIMELISIIEKVSHKKIKVEYKPYILEEAEDLHALHPSLISPTSLSKGVQNVLDDIYREKV
jgi:nucleoside-diphosphate-sugar epimerase